MSRFLYSVHSLLAALGLMLAVTTPYVTYAAGECSSPLGCDTQVRFGSQVGSLKASGSIDDLGPAGFNTRLDAAISSTALNRPAAPQSTLPASPAGVFIGPGFCWHDDHAFLPAGALTGISCDSHTSANTVDPGAVARQMFDHLDLPNLRINMNPRLGMVAVPTWFWVEGYGGNVIPLTDNLVVTHQECHDVATRDAGGNATLDQSGAPATHQECKTISDTISVNVRAFPRAFHWTFGDRGDQTVPCADLMTCTAGIGTPFSDAHVASSIAHAYRWSSLGINGANDAYSVGLAITFGAQFRFSINGHSASDWQSLGDRDLTWSALHQVQEAQAVLTRPCPVSDLVRC